MFIEWMIQMLFMHLYPTCIHSVSQLDYIFIKLYVSFSKATYQLSSEHLPSSWRVNKWATFYCCPLIQTHFQTDTFCCSSYLLERCQRNCSSTTWFEQHFEHAWLFYIDGPFVFKAGKVKGLAVDKNKHLIVLGRHDCLQQNIHKTLISSFQRCSTLTVCTLLLSLKLSCTVSTVTVMSVILLAKQLFRRDLNPSSEVLGLK